MKQTLLAQAITTLPTIIETSEHGTFMLAVTQAHTTVHVVLTNEDDVDCYVKLDFEGNKETYIPTIAGDIVTAMKQGAQAFINEFEASVAQMKFDLEGYCDKSNEDYTDIQQDFRERVQRFGHSYIQAVKNGLSGEAAELFNTINEYSE